MSVVEFGRVEISRQVGASFVGDLVESSSWFAQQTALVEFRTPFVHTGAVSFDVIRDDLRTQRKLRISEEFEDLVVYSHLHPRSSLSPHTAAVSRLGFIFSDRMFELNNFMEHFPLVRGNTYTHLVSKVGVMTTGRALGGEICPGRASQRSDPVVTAPQCEKTLSGLIKAPTKTAEESELTLATYSRENTTTRLFGKPWRPKMACDVCGSRCHGRRCSLCEDIANAEDQVADTETFECPTCGGRTSGEGVECYQCRGGSDD